MSGDLERMLHDFVQGGHTLAEEDLIMQALVSGLLCSWIALTMSSARIQAASSG